MTKSSLSFKELQESLTSSQYKSISFDIDGTVYPILSVQLRWWKNVLIRPRDTRRFYVIKCTWEKRRQGDSSVRIDLSDQVFFENYLMTLLSPGLVSPAMRTFLLKLKDKYQLMFLSDHGGDRKLRALELSHLGPVINCLTETGELKPHFKISRLLSETYGIDPETHVHVGDRWSDESQARIFGCDFIRFECK